MHVTYICISMIWYPEIVLMNLNIKMQNWVNLILAIYCTRARIAESAMGWMIGVQFPVGVGIFLFSIMSRLALGPTQPPIQCVPGALSLGVKQLGHEADHSPASRAKVKEYMEVYLHSPNMPQWHGSQLKHRGNFTFTLLNHHHWYPFAFISFMLHSKECYLLILRWKSLITRFVINLMCLFLVHFLVLPFAVRFIVTYSLTLVVK
jgi:hypothetical protein